MNLSQILKDKEGKLSAKRFWGGAILILCGIAFVLDGLGFYEVNSTLFNSFLLAGTSLVGLDTIKKFAKK
jgi:hypothetical protein